MLLDHTGLPIQAANFKAESSHARQTACWKPERISSDEEIKGKAVIDGRAHDLVRNNGYAAGALQQEKDNVIGAQYRLSLRPDNYILNLDQEELRKWTKLVEAMFTLYAESPDCWIDAQRKMTFSQLLRVSVGYDFTDGEFMMTREWRPDVRSQFSTCFHVLAPERVSNPLQLRPRLEDIRRSQKKLHEGVEVDRYGAALAYHLRLRHPSEHIALIRQGRKTHRRIPKFDKFGFQQFFHIFETTKAGQRRGISRFAPIIQKLKMLDTYEDVELEQNILAATFGMYVQSEFGANSIFEALAGDKEIDNPLTHLIGEKTKWAATTDLHVDGAKVPHLFPGESIETVSSDHPNKNFEGFEDAMLRQVAKASNKSLEQITGDYRKTNRSSARISMAESWKYVTSKRPATANRTASHIFRTWLDEAVFNQHVPMPKGVRLDDYLKVREALTRCTWMGTGKGQEDEFAKAKADDLNLKNNATTLRDIHAEKGNDWEDQMEQRELEAKALIEASERLGIEMTDEQKLQLLGIKPAKATTK